MEIEVKFAVSEDQVDSLRKRLSELGAGKPRKAFERDTYLRPFGPDIALRIREREEDHKKKHVLTLKKGVREGDAKFVEEIEGEISPEVIRILEELGHTPVVTKEKFRETFSLGTGNETVNVNLDFLKELGWFVELEYLGDENMALQRLRDACIALGLNWDKRITKTYIAMLMERKNKP